MEPFQIGRPAKPSALWTDIASDVGVCGTTTRASRRDGYTVGEV